MIKERALELVAALRSGKYQQTKNRLKNQNNFCCLGVACDLSGLGEWQAYSVGDQTAFSYVIDGLEEYDILPVPVKRYFGFRTCFGDFLAGEMSLIEMNDKGKSFFEIADFIEQNWEQL